MESLRKDSNAFREISTTCFQIHPQSLGTTFQFKENLPVRPHCFSKMSNIQNRHHFDQNCKFPFKPEINQLPFELYPEQHNNYHISRQQRFQRLVKDSREKHNKLKDIKVRTEEQYFNSLKFQPNLSRIKSQTASSNCPKENIFQRLYEDFTIRSKSFDILQNKVSNYQTKNQQQQQFNSNWKTILNVEKCDMKPLYQRLKQVADYRTKLKRALLQENQAEHPFHPCIIQHKLKSPTIKKNVVDRLMEQIQKKKYRRQQLSKKYQQIENQLLTFKPKLNPYIFTDRSQQFIERLSNYDRHSTKFIPDQHFFTPQINKMSKLLVEHIRKQQTQNQAMYRLSYYDNQQKRNKIAEMTQQYYQQYTFNPQINEISKACNAKPTSHACTVPKKKNYSFQPSINECSRFLAKDYIKNQSERKYKQSRIKDKIKYQQEYEELKQCTFHPKINNNSNPVSLRKKVDVNGTNIYYKRLQNFTKKKLEQQQYQDKIFRWDKKYDLRVNRQKILS